METMTFSVAPFAAPEITSNFEELKDQIGAIAAAYSLTEYTPEKLTEAREDAAKLRKMKAAIEDVRKRVKKTAAEPYERFAAQCKELTGLLDDQIERIADVVRSDEQRRKAERQVDITRRLVAALMPLDLSDYAGIILDRAEKEPESILGTKVFNLSAAASETEKTIADAAETIAAGIAAVKAWGCPEALEVYARTLSLPQAQAELTRIHAIRERTAQRAAEVMPKPEPVPDAVPEPMPEKAEPAEKRIAANTARQWVRMKVYINSAEGAALRRWLIDNNIKFAAG